MKKLNKILGAVASTATLAAMGWIGFESYPTPAQASVTHQIQETVQQESAQEIIRPRARPNLWQRSSAEERECMALNIYHEARGEPILGQIAVAQVTLNRMELHHYPDTVCGVVWQRRQFSWTHDGHSDTPREIQAWEKSKLIAQIVMESWDSGRDITQGADHYHADSVNPGWADRNRVTTRIGVHTFYDLL